MKAETANSKRLDILGNGKTLSNQEILDSIVKKWRQKLGYCSILAAIPAMLVSQVPVAHSDEAKKSEANVGSRGPRLRKRNTNFVEPAVLKRQSEFLLPHQQQGSFRMLAALAGNDDCPGRAIPSGNYTAASPYLDNGDTTGANDTVTRTCFNGYCYGFYVDAVPGPDHIYSFTLTGRGADPQIQISRTAGTYEPVAYILNGTRPDACLPRGIGMTAWTIVAEGLSQGGTSTIDRRQMDLLPLNVPLHLFVDSAHTDARSSGPYAIRIQDVAIAPAVVCPVPNPIDCADIFVGRHYIDFLTRAPDPAGLAFWTNEIDTCATDAGCIEVKRINVSAAFYLSIEFQETGYLVYRLSKVSRGNLRGAPVPIRLDEFLSNTQQIGEGVIVNQTGWELVLENNKQAFAAELVRREGFSLAFPTSMTPSQFVDQLFANAEITPGTAERAAAVNEFGSAITSADQAARARALRRVAENATLRQKEFNRAFVLMQYFGYLRRNPNDAPEPTRDFQGYNFWLNKLNQFGGNFVDAEMVKAFITSTEYRQRFGQ